MEHQKYYARPMATKSSLAFALQWLAILLLPAMNSTSATAQQFGIHGFNPLRRTFHRRFLAESNTTMVDVETFFYNQTLDHFNYRPESFNKFPQRYAINSKHWGGANSNAPIFAFLGAEQPMDIEIRNIGFLAENAPRFKALQVYIEHRYYGKSVPFGSKEEAFKNASTRGYFTSAQALADYAEILIHVKEKFQAKDSPVIVFGGSYGGELASWFRLKYPHIALGALASSAPMLQFDDKLPMEPYDSVVRKAYKESSESCYRTISQSMGEIDKIASQPNGLSILSKKFKTCKPLANSTELKTYVSDTFRYIVQFNLPNYNVVDLICKTMDKPQVGNDILGSISRCILAVQFAKEGEKPCYDLDAFFSAEISDGWNWQTCSDIAMRHTELNDTFLYPNHFNLEDYINECKSKYEVPPRPHWVTTYFGGHDIKLTLKRFGSNIIFSNGMVDPWYTTGILEDISDTIVAVKTKKGSHCLDLHPTTKTDPKWLTEQRKIEVKHIERWINQYYSDLRAYKQGKQF